MMKFKLFIVSIILIVSCNSGNEPDKFEIIGILNEIIRDNPHDFDFKEIGADFCDLSDLDYSKYFDKADLDYALHVKSVNSKFKLEANSLKWFKKDPYFSGYFTVITDINNYRNEISFPLISKNRERVILKIYDFDNFKTVIFEKKNGHWIPETVLESGIMCMF